MKKPNISVRFLRTPNGRKLQQDEGTTVLKIKMLNL
jgi:hypothetical protein